MSKMPVIVVSLRLIFDLLFRGDKKERMFFLAPFLCKWSFSPSYLVLNRTRHNEFQQLRAIIDKNCKKKNF